MKKRALAVVTGGAGFIGSHMVDALLARDFRVHVIDNLSSGRLANLKEHAKNSDLHVEEQDIRSLKKESALFREADFVFHFAGMGDIVPSIEKPSEYMEVNVQGTVKVLEAARFANVQKLVYAASSSCYGLAKTPTDEKAEICPQYPYALSKYLGELACLHWHQVYGLGVNVIRIFNAYGTRSRTSGAYGAVMGVFLKQKLEGCPYTVVGDGTQKRDFIYATDVADAFFRAATTSKNGEIYNLGSGNPQSINRLVELLGGKEVIYLPTRPGEPYMTFANIDKIRSDLGFEPQISFEEGVRRLLAQISYWKEAPLWDEKSIAQSTKTWFTYLGKKSACRREIYEENQVSR